MTDILPLILVVAVVVLTIVLTVVAVYLILFLAELRKSIKKINGTVDSANQILNTTQGKIEGILNPFHSLSAFVSNFTAGLKVAEGFMGWMSKNRSDDEEAETKLAKRK